MAKSINEMYVSDFRSLPHRNWDQELTFDSLIIIPADIWSHQWLWHKIRVRISRLLRLREPEKWETVKGLHDSNYRCMDFVAVKKDTPVCLLSGCSDVIHVNGIGGYGKDWLQKYNTVPRTIEPIPWSIDCLPTSGLLRMFASGYEFTCGPALSSFTLFAERETSEAKT